MSSRIKVNRRYTIIFIGIFALIIVGIMSFGTNNVKAGTPGIISATQDITVDTQMNPGTYIRSKDLIGDMFVVKAGATLTINKGVTIDGNKENLLFQKEVGGYKYVQGALIKVEAGGKLVVNSGILQNNADTAIKVLGGELSINGESLLQNNGSFSGYEVSTQVSDGTSIYSFAEGACHGEWGWDNLADYYNSSKGWDNEIFPNLLVYLNSLLKEWVEVHKALGDNPTNTEIKKVNQLQKNIFNLLVEDSNTPWTDDGYTWGNKFPGCPECQQAIGFPGDYEKTTLPVNGDHIKVSNTVGEITYVYGTTTYEQKGGAIYASANSIINITGGHIGGSGESDIEVDYAIPDKQTGMKKFINANVATDGGAIYIEGSNSKLNISGGLFMFNDVANRFTHIPEYNSSTNESDKYTPIVSEEHGLGGAIYAGDGSKVVMSGGSIGSSNNDNTPNSNRANGGAGVNVAKGAEFTIESGFIDGNNTLFGLGGGVRIDGGVFNMTGGTIKNNRAFWGVIGCKDNQNSGAGVALASVSSVFNMSGGLITQNISVHHGAGVFLNETTDAQNFMTFKMTGGTIISNNAVGVTGSEVYVSNGNKKIFLSGGSIIHSIDEQKLDSSALWVANNTTYFANDKNFIRLDGTVFDGLIYLTKNTQYLEATPQINLEKNYKISLSEDYIAGNKVIEIINNDLELSSSILSHVNVLTSGIRLQQGENNHIYVYEFTSADDTYFIKNYDNKEFNYGTDLPNPSICWKALPNNQVSATNVEYKYYVKNTVTGEYLESAVKNVGEYKIVVTFIDTTGNNITEQTSVTALFKVTKKTVTIQVSDFETKQGESFSPTSDKITITGLQYGETIALTYKAKPALDKDSVSLANTYFTVGTKYDITVSIERVYENYDFTIENGTKVTILHSQEYDDFLSTNSQILSKDIANITKSDLTSINNALTQYAQLEDYSSRLLVDEKAALDQKFAVADYLSTNAVVLEKSTANIVEALNEIKAMTDESVKAALAEEKQNLDDKLAKIDYIKNQEVILGKELSDITKEDITAINNALSSLEGLSEATKAALASEKENLEQKLTVSTYLTNQNQILEKLTANIVEEDREKIIEALNEIKAMTDESVKNVLVEEKQNLDEKLAKIDFMDHNKIILNKDIVLITKTDIVDIKKAISEYNNLSQEAKDSLVKDKVILDKLLMAASYLETNSTILGKNISDITESDKIIITLALEDIKSIDDEDVLRALSNEKQELQDKLTKINFKENHQTIFNKEYSQIIKEDLTIINNALSDYEKLTEEIKNGLEKEKLELDRKLAIAMVDAALLENDVEQAIAIANIAKDAISKATTTSHPTIDELVANAKLDIAKVHGKENINELLEVNDDDIIKEIIKKAQNEIDLVTSPNGEAQIDLIIEKTAKQIELERVKRETKDLMKDKVNELKSSGKYDDNGIEALTKILEESNKKITDVTMNDMDIAKALADVDKIYEDFKQKIKDVDIISTGSILPPDKDGNFVPDDEADYAEGYDPKKDGLFGNVNNLTGMEGDIALVIKSTDKIKDFKKIAKKTAGLNKLELKSTLDINLMQDNVKFTEYSGEYRVKVLLPADLRNYEVVKLAIVNADGTMSVVNAKVEGKFMSFTTTAFGEFVILTDKTTNLLWLNILFGIIILLELGWITFWHLGGKKFFDKKTGATEATSEANEVKLSCSSISIIILAFSVTAPISIVEGIIICLLGGYIAYLFLHKKPQVEEEIAPVNDVERVGIEELLFDERQAALKQTAVQEMTKGIDEQVIAVQTVSETQKLNIMSEYQDLMAEYNLLKQKIEEQGLPASFMNKETMSSKAKISFSKRVFARYEYGVKARLIQSGEEIQTRFNEIYNYLMSFKGVKCRESFKYYTFNSGRQKLARLHFRGKTLCLALALNPITYADTKYSVEDISQKDKYLDLPSLLRIRSGRGMQYAKELIALMLGDKAFEQVNNRQELLPFETLEQLIAQGLVKVHEMKEPVAVAEESISIQPSISASEVKDRMSDESANAFLQKMKSDEKITGTKKGIINLDTICANFLVNEVITINKLKEKKLLSSNICYVKILARGTIDKPLIIKAQDFSLEAIKMIVLTGGECVKLD